MKMAALRQQLKKHDRARKVLERRMVVTRTEYWRRRSENRYRSSISAACSSNVYNVMRRNPLGKYQP